MEKKLGLHAVNSFLYRQDLSQRFHVLVGLRVDHSAPETTAWYWPVMLADNTGLV